MIKKRNKYPGPSSPLNEKLVPLENEKWKDVVGYEGLYKVSNLGRIYSIGRYVPHKRLGRKWVNSCLLNQTEKDHGYLYVSLCKDGKVCKKLSHIIVAQAFIPNPNNYLEIDHIDTITSNNKVTNLRWCTKTMNMNNPISLKKASLNARLKWKFNDPKSSKPILRISKEGIVKIYPSISEAVRDGFHKGHIIKVCSHKKETYRGYSWSYYSK